MAGQKFALLVATDHYEEDTQLGQLRAPANDVRRLAAVLRNRQVAGFEVRTLCNKPHHQIARAIGEFYAGRGRDDLVLLYFTGHGVKDESGRLHMATTDTRISNLRFTSVQADQVSAAMNECRSGQKVLILDCCFAGAFPSGFDRKSDQAPVNALAQLGGRGSVVLTSSDAMQYSFEENRLTDSPSTPKPISLFTRIMVEGLRAGTADLDHDGDITLDELYRYVHDRVTTEQPHQRPQIKEDVDGRIRIAQNIGWRLPPHIVSAIGHPNRDIKLSVLRDLPGLYSRGNALVRQRVLEAVRMFAEDDSAQVKQAADQLIAELGEPEGQPQDGERPVRPVARPAGRRPGTRRGEKRQAGAAAVPAPEKNGQAEQEAEERGRYEAVQKQREVEEWAREAGLRAEKEWQESARYSLQEVLSSVQRAERRKHRMEVSAERPDEGYAQKSVIEDSVPGTVSSSSTLSGPTAGQVSADDLRDWSRWLVLVGIGLLAIVLITLVVLVATS